MTDPLIRQLVEARLKAGLSQRKVARAMPTVQSHLWLLEHGSDPQLSTLRRWARVFGLDVALVPLAYHPTFEVPQTAPKVPADAAATDGHLAAGDSASHAGSTADDHAFQSGGMTDIQQVIKRELWARLDEVMRPVGSRHELDISATTLGDWLGDRVFAALVEAGLASAAPTGGII